MPVPLNVEALALINKQVGKHLTHLFSYRGKPIMQVSTKAWYATFERAGTLRSRGLDDVRRCARNGTHVAQHWFYTAAAGNQEDPSILWSH
jgi:hypothetical protein